MHKDWSDALPGSEAVVTRVAKKSYGPMNPPQRPNSGARGKWGRYDVPDHRTVYAASPPQAAYAEALASQRPGLSALTVGDFFDLPDDDAISPDLPLIDLVASDWTEHHHPPGTVFAGWRHDRLEYTLTLPTTGWFVDITHHDSVQVLRTAMSSTVLEYGELDFSTSTLTSEHRELTSRIASWIRRQILDDGSLPHGIKYGSKHGTDYFCWAVWLRGVDDGHPTTAEPTKVKHESEVQEHRNNPALAAIAKLFGLKCW